MRKDNVPRGAIALVSLAAAAALAACSSNGGNGGGTADGSGDTIHVGSLGSITSSVYTNPDNKAGMLAAIDAVNAAGGVNGKKIELTYCDSHQETAAEVNCAQQLVEDNVIAAISPLVTADGTGRPFQILDKAGIASVGTVGATPAELNTAGVFPLGSGLPGWDYGATAALVARGDTKIAVIDDTTAPAQFNGQLAVAALKLAGLKPTVVVTADPTSDPTLSSAAAKATGSGAQAILMLPSPPNVPKLVAAVKQTGFKGPIATSDGELQAPIIKAMGASANGFLISSAGTAFATDSSNTAVAQYEKDMKKYQPNAGITSDSLRTWSAVQLFVQVLKSSKATSAKDFMAAMDNLSTPVDVGTIAPYKVKGVTSPVPAYPRLLNPTVQFGVLQNGVIKPDGKGFVNPFTLLKAKAGS